MDFFVKISRGLMVCHKGAGFIIYQFDILNHTTPEFIKYTIDILYFKTCIRGVVTTEIILLK